MPTLHWPAYVSVNLYLAGVTSSLFSFLKEAASPRGLPLHHNNYVKMSQHKACTGTAAVQLLQQHFPHSKDLSFRVHDPSTKASSQTLLTVADSPAQHQEYMLARHTVFIMNNDHDDHASCYMLQWLHPRSCRSLGHVQPPACTLLDKGS